MCLMSIRHPEINGQEEYAQLVVNQKGLCAICKRPEISRSKLGMLIALTVDHCAKTGKIRGLLCNRCNRALGLFQHDADSLLAAYHYIVRHQS
jgi:hypothetical protein